MKNSSLIGHLVEVFERAYDPSAPVDRTLNLFYRSHRYLGAKDRRFISEHLYGLLRHTRLIEFQISRLLDAGVVTADPGPGQHLLVYLVYAVQHRSQTVAEVMEDTADLREDLLEQSHCEEIIRWVQDHDVHSVLPDDPVSRDAILYSVPDFLVREWHELLGEEAHELAVAMNLQAPVTLRVNTLRISRDACIELLRREGVETGRTQISPDGLTVSRRSGLTSLNVFRSGLIEAQDEGSQVISYLVNPREGETVIDACGGAGGKGLHIAALMNNRGRILSVDPDQRRQRESVTRARRSGVDIIQMFHPSDSGLAREKGKADRVLVDAPCSGSGVFRRNPWTKLFLTAEKVETFARDQKEILSHYASFVRPGGRLVYATCSLCRAENEDIVNSFLTKEPMFRSVSIDDALAGSPLRLEHQGKFLRLYPHRHGTDGFFASVLERIDH